MKSRRNFAAGAVLFLFAVFAISVEGWLGVSIFSASSNKTISTQTSTRQSVPTDQVVSSSSLSDQLKKIQNP